MTLVNKSTKEKGQERKKDEALKPRERENVQVFQFDKMSAL